MLELTVEEAVAAFDDDAAIRRPLRLASAVGIGHLVLGQSTDTLSGGEAQRLAVATAAGRRQQRVLLLDEPTRGLGFDEVPRFVELVGPAKSDRLLDAALRVGVNAVAIESTDEIMRLDAAARRAGVRDVDVLVRLRRRLQARRRPAPGDPPAPQPPPQPPKPRRSRNAAPRSRSACGACATSTSSATSTDPTRPDHLARREAIHAELAELAPDPLPDLDQARDVLDDFGIFWRLETDPDAKRQLLSLIFERVWLDDRRVVAVQPKPAFAPFFQQAPHKTAAKAMCKERERRDSNPRPPA